MKYSIKTPIMVTEIPDLLDNLFSGKTQEVIRDVIGKFTVDQSGNSVPLDKLTVKEYMELIPYAMAALGFSDEGKD